MSFSFEAVLHADKITIFALIFKLETSDADKIHHFLCGFDGGVNTKNGSLNPSKDLKLMRVLQMKLHQVFHINFFDILFVSLFI